VSIFFLITANNVGASQFPHFTVNTNPVKDWNIQNYRSYISMDWYIFIISAHQFTLMANWTVYHDVGTQKSNLFMEHKTDIDLKYILNF
jgi:hypothetical protein